MKISLTWNEILSLASIDPNPQDELLGTQLITAAARGWMERADLLAAASWKWRGGRLRKLCELNKDEDI